MLKLARRLLLLFACFGLVGGMPIWEAGPCCPCGPEEAAATAALPEADGPAEQQRCGVAEEKHTDDCAEGCLSCCVCCHIQPDRRLEGEHPLAAPPPGVEPESSTSIL